MRTRTRTRLRTHTTRTRAQDIQRQHEAEALQTWVERLSLLNEQKSSDGIEQFDEKLFQVVSQWPLKDKIHKLAQQHNRFASVASNVSELRSVATERLVKSDTSVADRETLAQTQEALLAEIQRFAQHQTSAQSMLLEDHGAAQIEDDTSELADDEAPLLPVPTTAATTVVAATNPFFVRVVNP